MAPDFTLETNRGTTVRLSDYQGRKCVVLYFTGSRKGSEQVVNHLKLPFPVLADPDRAVYRRYGLDKAFLAIQRSGTFLIDRQGQVGYIEQGALPQMLNKEVLMQELEKLHHTNV